MTILIFGDIVAKPGRKAMTTILPRLRETYKADYVIANAENLSHGIGATPSTIKEMQDAGVDLFTSGNHIWKKGEISTLLSAQPPVVLRPANYPPGLAGTGERLVTIGAREILVINLLGRVFFKEDFDCPFRSLDEILTRYHLRWSQPKEPTSKAVDGILVDFHAEASSEKNAFGRYADGRVTAVWGTHTHVPSADSMTLPNGSVYRSDVGMVGLKHSVIGADAQSVIRQFLTQVGEPKMHDVDDHGDVRVDAQLLEFEGPTIKRWQPIQEFITI